MGAYTIQPVFERKKRGSMNFKLNTAAAAILAASLIGPYAYATDPAPPAKKHVATKKEKKPEGPTVEEQIQSLRQEMQGQINGLKNDLANKDAQLKQAQQAAADAQAAAAAAQAAASAQQQAVSDNAAAVTTLQTTVTDLKGNQASLATTVSDETAKIKKEVSNPDVLHFKGVTITPGGFAAGETVYRTKATGGDIPTAFNAIPYENSGDYQLSEFYGSGRQSRVTLSVDGKTSWGTLRGYYEADWLGTGITSNNNQSNSYVLRQRVIYAQAETNSRWAFTGGQMWSLATENGKGITAVPSNELTPLTIDPNYVPGFVWTRQYGFRVVKSFNHAAFGISAENPQLLYTASLAGNEPYAVIGSAGANGGNYNAAISTCTPSTTIVNYTNQKETDSAGNTIDVFVPVYKTVNGCSDIATISFNNAPDIITKMAFDPGWGHYEVFGIMGFAHETVYPGETTNSNLYGGLKDIATGANVAPALTTAGYVNNAIILGGIGGGFRVPVVPKVLTVGAKALYGPGMGRYGDSTLADVTANQFGELEPIHNLSGLITVEANPTPRLTLYLNYGGDYAGRDDYANAGSTTLGAPSADFCPTTAGAFPCTTAPTAANIAAGGSWGGHWGAPSAAAVGYGSRVLSNSACTSLSAPGYNGGGSTGYIPGGSCGAQVRDVQEITGGYWYDIYKGDRGRLRQSIQYGYAVREGWSGASGIGAKGIDNMLWTSFRYYLP
jgi:type II secretory pathway pseudopilin PulG